MAVLPVNPLLLKDIDLLLGSGTPDDFGAHVDAVTFTPSATTMSWTGLKQNTFTDVSTATWTCVLNYVQDWDSTNSLSRYLYEHEGETIPAEFTPRDGGPSFTADLVITPGAIGGTVNAYATTSVTLGCTSKPALVPAA